MADPAAARKQIKHLLREASVKLWEPPYTLEGGQGSIPPELVARFAQSSSLDAGLVASILEDIRQDAVNRKTSNSAAPHDGHLGTSPGTALSTPSSNAAVGDLPLPTVSSVTDVVLTAAAANAATPAAVLPAPGPESVTLAPPATPIVPSVSVLSSAEATPAAAATAAATAAAQVTTTAAAAAAAAVAGLSNNEPTTDQRRPSATASVSPGSHSPAQARATTLQASSSTGPRAPSPNHTERTDSGAHGADASGTEDTDGEHEEGAKGKKSKKKGLDVASFFRRKKKDKEGKVVSFENTAFFAAQAQAQAQAEQAKQSEDPMYFDQLSPEQQEEWIRRNTISKSASDSAEPTPAIELTVTAPADAPESAGASLPAPAGALDVAGKHDAKMASTDSLHEGAAGEEPARRGSAGVALGWRRSPSGSQLIMDVPSSVTVDLTKDPKKFVSLSEESQPHHKKKGLLSRLLRHDDKPQVTRLPPVAPIAPARMDFKANELKLTNAELIEVMSMVKSKQLSVDDAIKEVLKRQQERQSTAKSEPAALPAEHSSASPAPPSAPTAPAAEEAGVRISLGPSGTAGITIEDLNMLAKDIAPPLRHMTMERPAGPPGRQLPRRRHTASGQGDLAHTDSQDDSDEDAEKTTPGGPTPASAPAATHAPTQPAEAQAAVPARAAPAFRAADLQLSESQRVEVMELVKRGQLSVDQAIAKVLQVDQQLRDQPKEDAEGYKIAPSTDVFAATFAPAPDSDDEEAAASRASKSLAFKIKPLEDDPFAAHARPVTGAVPPANEGTVAAAVAAAAFGSAVVSDAADPFAVPAKAAAAAADASDPFAAAPVQASAANVFDPFGPAATAGSSKPSVGSDVGPDGRRLSSFFATTDDFAQLASAVPVLHTIAQAEAGDPFAGGTDLDSSA